LDSLGNKSSLGIVDSSVLKQVFLQLSFKGNCKGEFRLKIACAKRTGCYLVVEIKRACEMVLCSDTLAPGFASNEVNSISVYDVSLLTRQRSPIPLASER
jgi:hypothetical protein